MAINPLHFAGSPEPPTALAEVLARRPVLGTGERPQALVELAERRSIIVRTRSQQPEVTIQRLEDVSERLWRIDLPPEERHEFSVIPGRTAQRERPEVFLRETDASTPNTGFKPHWADALFAPRPAPQREIPSMRRLSGRPIEPLDVFGADDRRVFQDAAWPWGLIGKVITSRGTGTGVLVGDRVVATAGHMVPWGDSSWWMLFVPAFYDGTSLHGAGVSSYVSDVRGFDSSGEVAGYDWAILRLYAPLGQSLGYFGYNGYSSSWNNQPYWSIVVYPGAVAGGQRPSYQNGITIFDVDSYSNGGEELESQTADLTPGNSGGPMFAWWDGDPRVVGVVSGAETDYIFPFSSERANVMASGSGFSNLIAWGRTNWPA